MSVYKVGFIPKVHNLKNILQTYKVNGDNQNLVIDLIEKGF